MKSGTNEGETCVDSSFTAGSKHVLHLCSSPAGDLTLFADGAEIGATVVKVPNTLPTPANRQPPPDLAGGRIVIGSDNTTPSAVRGNWQGFVTRAAVCPFGPVASCQ